MGVTETLFATIGILRDENARLKIDNEHLNAEADWLAMRLAQGYHYSKGKDPFWDLSKLQKLWRDAARGAVEEKERLDARE